MNEHKLSIKCTDLLIPLMALFALDFLDLSGIILTLVLLILFVFCGKEVKLDGMSLLLILFSVAYTLSVFYYDGLTIDAIIKYALAPWGSYVLGFNILRLKRNVASTKISKLLLVGFFTHGALNLAASAMQFGVDFNNIYRQAYDFWQGRVISVTTASLYYSPLVFYSIGVLFSRNTRKKKVLNIIVIAIAAFATLLYQNRTLILAAAVVLIVGAISILLDSQVSKSSKAYFVLGTIATLAVIIVLWMADVGGVRSLIQGTSFYARLTGANGEGQDRTKIWASFIFGEAWKYPFGGSKAILYKNKPFVHNMWLDIFRKGGIIPFVSIVIFTLNAVKSTILYVKQGVKKNEDYRSIAFAMIGIAVMFFVEPVMDANPYIFYLPLIMVGLFNGELCINRMEDSQ